MTDPRYNLLSYDGSPLLAKTGAHLECVSKWGDDGIYDMVGNLAEWVEDGRKGNRGTFLGGFYAIHAKIGCDKEEPAHGKYYYDYSIGARCCSALQSH